MATAGGVGFFPVAPGTAGSLAALLLYAPLRAWASHPLFLVVIALVVAAGVWASDRVEREWGTTDPGPVVIDEVLGMWMSLVWLPLSWAGVGVAFLLFRIFDIVKPYPARRAEAAPGGWGIMLDDAVAGLYANAVLRLATMVWPALTLA
jgi:phosphatidylglycerophosphatase A